MQSLRLLQIASPGLPVGAYSYSQGLEYAVETGWVNHKADVEQWLQEQLSGVIACQDLPLFARIYKACRDGDFENIKSLSQQVIAYRETTELRQEERLRGRAMCNIVSTLTNGQTFTATLPQDNLSQIAVFADYCCCEKIPLVSAMEAYCFSWIESQVTAAIKLVPLGQTEGQQIIYATAGNVSQAIENALSVDDDDIGYSNTAVAMASSFHETQYTRLFRS